MLQIAEKCGINWKVNYLLASSAIILAAIFGFIILFVSKLYLFSIEYYAYVICYFP